MKEYLKLIDDFLQKKLEFTDFYSAFNILYASDSTSSLPDRQFQFIDEINEQLFFVGENPSDVERKEHNYLDDDQFRDWLGKLKQKNETLWSA
jgi:hypothetical protein